MRNIPIEFIISNDELKDKTAEQIEESLLQTIRTEIAIALSAQLNDDGFIDITPDSKGYLVQCNLTLGSQKEFYDAVADVAVNLNSYLLNTKDIPTILSPLYKLMGEDVESVDAVEEPVSYEPDDINQTAISSVRDYYTEDVIDALRSATLTQIPEPSYDGIKVLIKTRSRENIDSMISIAERQGYIEFNVREGERFGCSNIVFKDLVTQVLIEKENEINSGTIVND